MSECETFQVCRWNTRAEKWDDLIGDTSSLSEAKEFADIAVNEGGMVLVFNDKNETVYSPRKTTIRDFPKPDLDVMQRAIWMLCNGRWMISLRVDGKTRGTSLIVAKRQR